MAVGLQRLAYDGMQIVLRLGDTVYGHVEVVCVHERDIVPRTFQSTCQSGVEQPTLRLQLKIFDIHAAVAGENAPNVIFGSRIINEHYLEVLMPLQLEGAQ